MNRYTRIKDFHTSRSTGVGSSDIPILAGLYRRNGSTSLTVWEGKTWRRDPWQGNERTRVGKDLEAYVLMRFVEEKYGPEVAYNFYMAKLRDKSVGPFKSNTECRHHERAYCLAHADLLVDGSVRMKYDESSGSWVSTGDPLEPYIVEGKTVGAYAAKRREGEIFTGYDLDDRSAQGIPDSVFLQVQWQLYCYGVELAYVAALIDNQYYTFGPIHADSRVQEKCLALAERFWRLVLDDTPPAPETWDDVQRLFPHQKNTTAMVGGEEEMRIREMIKRDKEIAARMKQYEDERDDIKNAIGIYLGENSVLAAADGSVLAKSTEQSRESVTLLSRANAIKKEQGKKNPAPLTAADVRVLELAEEVRTLGLVSVSEFRVARY